MKIELQTLIDILGDSDQAKDFFQRIEGFNFSFEKKRIEDQDEEDQKILQAYQEGRTAHKNGFLRRDNPYKMYPFNGEWLRGFNSWDNINTR